MSVPVQHLYRRRIVDLHSSFDFSVRFLHSQADDADLDYQGLSVLASYFHRFNL
jgi:hypothetical protein